MKNKIFILIMLVQVFAAFSVLAETNIPYVPLEPLPGLTQRTDIETGQTSYYLSDYLQAVFAFGISLAGIFAVLMIVIGGIEYITAYGNPGRAENAKNRIWQALLGLLLVVSAWLILYTINPDLTKGQLNIPSISITPSTSPAPVVSPSTPTAPSTPSTPSVPSTPTTPTPTTPSSPTPSVPAPPQPSGYFIVSPENCNAWGGTVLRCLDPKCHNSPGLCVGNFICCELK